MGHSVALSGALGQMRLKIIEDRPVGRAAGGLTRAIGEADRNGGHTFMRFNVAQLFHVVSETSELLPEGSVSVEVYADPSLKRP